MYITNIKSGSNSINDYRGKLLYAELKNERGELVCSATLDFILLTYFENQNKIHNYQESFSKYIKFQNKLIEKLHDSEYKTD